ncbi:hypothetical protein PF010_g26760 [Phytophthora fragariae]|uniref:Uncharacterized protein n=2 Tax=Phytophthora fragariae TaxID=53985 RepID=A0A6G0JVS9_9STRA|nr:hypothetical protein PF010_g26760 [Phytophthora fragariae]
MHSSPPSKCRHTASSALETSSASDTKRRKITAEQGSGPAAAESIRYDPPSGESCGEPAPVVPGSPAPSATVAVAPTLPPTESSGGMNPSPPGAYVCFSVYRTGSFEF